MYVVKRNGAKELFDFNKIALAMFKAYKGVGANFTLEDCQKQAEKITKSYKKDEDVNIERIQDDVENFLMQSKQYEAARSYIKYREKQKHDRENPWSDN